MTALTDLSDLINKSTGGNNGTPENLFFYKQARVAGAAPTALIAGRPHSLWLYDGHPGAGVTPAAVTVGINTLAGALQQANPGGSRQKFLTSAWAAGLVPGTLVLYDRLLYVGGLSGTSITAQNVQGNPVGATVLTRYTSGVGNIAFAEIYTAIGTAGSTITMSYNNQAGTNNTSPAVAFGVTNFNTQGRAIFLPTVSGDTGIQAVRTVTLATSSTTAGNFGVTIGHPLAYINVGQVGAAGWRDFTTGLPGIPEILTNACLAFLWIPNTTTAPEVFGGLTMLES